MWTALAAASLLALAAGDEGRPIGCDPALLPVVSEVDECAAAGIPFRIAVLQDERCGEPEKGLLIFAQAGGTAAVRRPGARPERWWWLDAAEPPEPPRLAAWTPTGACRRVETVLAGDGRVLALLRADHPLVQQQVAVLYDVRANAVLDVRDLGRSGEPVARSGEALWFRQGALGQCTGPYELAQEDAPQVPGGAWLAAFEACELFVNPVVKVWAEGDHIASAPDVARTFGFFKAFFSSEAAFLEASGWDGQGQPPKVFWTGRSARNRPCIGFFLSGTGLELRGVSVACGSP